LSNFGGCGKINEPPGIGKTCCPELQMMFNEMIYSYSYLQACQEQILFAKDINNGKQWQSAQDGVQ
jgi:hypothetical protein